MEKLVKRSANMDKLEYEMYQVMPQTELGAGTPIFGKDYQKFKEYMEKYIEEETLMNPKLWDATTNRYIYYVNDYPIGQVGIRTNLNGFWRTRGSQIFYTIRFSE